MPDSSPAVLIIDDDPSHLKLYSWVVSRGGFRALTALVGSTSVDLPEGQDVSVVLLDYRLASALTAKDVALLVKSSFPHTPIVLLSDLPWMPSDMANVAVAFASKGEPETLIQTLQSLTKCRAGK